MNRACRAAMAAVGLLGKVAVGFVALIVLVGAVLPTAVGLAGCSGTSEPGEREAAFRCGCVESARWRDGGSPHRG